MHARDEIGRALRTYRIRGRLNQAALALALGVSQSQISRWESGRDRPRAHNLDAIETLVWGRDEPVLAALVDQVRAATGPLVLLDARLSLVAAARPLRVSGGALTRFGWVFDPRDNPVLDHLARRVVGFAARDPGVRGIRLTLPFAHEAAPWGAAADLTLYRLGPDLYGLGEIGFAPDPHALVVPDLVARRSGQGAGPRDPGDGSRGPAGWI